MRQVSVGRSLPVLAAVACLVGCAVDASKPVDNTAVANSAIDTKDNESIIVAPSRGTEEALLVIFPGAFLAPAKYLDLAKSIQQASPLKLWVAIAHFKLMDTPTFPEGEFALKGIMERVREQGFQNLTNDRVFLGGHSLGGIVAKDSVRAHGFGGLVLLAAYLPTLPLSPNLAEFSTPVLTLGGEIDGQTWITRLAKELAAYDALEAASGAGSLVRSKPVIVLPGVNHHHFAGGDPKPVDIPSDLSLQAAHRLIGSAVSDFITAQVLRSSDARHAQATSALSRRIDETRVMVRGFLEAQALERGPWCETAQRMVSGLDDAALGRLQITHEFFENLVPFVMSKPSLDVAAGQSLRLETRVHNSYAFDVADASPDAPETANEIACKMKNQAAIAKALQIAPGSGAVTCKDINEAAMRYALEHVSPAAKTRYLTKGYQLVFLPDKEVGTGISWVSSGLAFNKVSDGSRAFEVKSTGMVTSLDADARFAGMHYCKLLSPAKAVEWVMVDGLKSH